MYPKHLNVQKQPSYVANLPSQAEAERIFLNPRTSFCLLRSDRIENLELCYEYGAWKSPEGGLKLLLNLLDRSEHVIIFFNYVRSNTTYGYALLDSRPGESQKKDVPYKAPRTEHLFRGIQFDVRWIRRADIPYEEFSHIINECTNTRIFDARDGTEISREAGKQACAIFEIYHNRYLESSPNLPNPLCNVENPNSISRLAPESHMLASPQWLGPTMIPNTSVHGVPQTIIPFHPYRIFHTEYIHPNRPVAIRLPSSDGYYNNFITAGAVLDPSNPSVIQENNPNRIAPYRDFMTSQDALINHTFLDPNTSIPMHIIPGTDNEITDKKCNEVLLQMDNAAKNFFSCDITNLSYQNYEKLHEQGSALLGRQSANL